MITGGTWISDMGVESYVSVSIANSVFSILNKFYPGRGFVRLEEPLVSFYEYNRGLNKPGRIPDALRNYGRADIALWNNDKLVGTIEVKRKWSLSEFEKDYKRLKELVNRYGKIRSGDLQYAAFASFFFKSQVQCDNCDDCKKCLEECCNSIESCVCRVSGQKLKMTFSGNHCKWTGEDMDSGKKVISWGSAVVIEVS